MRRWIGVLLAASFLAALLLGCGNKAKQADPNAPPTKMSDKKIPGQAGMPGSPGR